MSGEGLSATTRVEYRIVWDDGVAEGYDEDDFLHADEFEEPGDRWESRRVTTFEPIVTNWVPVRADSVAQGREETPA